MPATNKRALAVMQISKYRKIGDFILKSRAISQDMSNNATTFPSPVPTLLVFNADIGKLESLQSNAMSRVPGAVANRNVAYNIVLADLQSLMAYVQNKADAANNFEVSSAIILSAGFAVKGAPSRNKPILEAKFDSKNNSIKLMAKAAGNRASYNWQYSTNAGVAWIDMPPTLQAKTTLTGVAISAQLAFRVRSITKDGPSAWSDGVTL